MGLRGTYNFEVNDSGDILYTKNNIELLQKFWLNREIINTEELGPGDPGDFDFGAWHIACHLVAACGVRKTNNGNFIWLEISYNPITKLYEPTLTIRENNLVNTIVLTSPQAKEYMKNSELVGFVEGTSEGRISVSGVMDSKELFNKNPRQDYDQEPGSPKEGGKVWEHWCTTRDIRSTSRIGIAVLDAYIVLVSASGKDFVPTVARGRTDYYHPTQLKAMVKTGFVSPESVQLNIKPSSIPKEASLLFQEATPESSMIAVEKLDWSNPLKYYMFSRRINKWNSWNNEQL